MYKNLAIEKIDKHIRSMKLQARNSPPITLLGQVPRLRWSVLLKIFYLVLLHPSSSLPRDLLLVLKPDDRLFSLGTSPSGPGHWVFLELRWATKTRRQ